jgi:N utilization substance protein B
VRALQILHAWELQDRPVLETTVRSMLVALPRCRAAIEEAEPLAAAVVADVDGLDRSIMAWVDHWRFERLGLVERNILRLATFELHTDVPPKVVITEAVELAHWFVGGTAPGFVNGVLDRAAHESGRL